MKNIQTILVTGAGGYVGTTLVPMLLQAGYHVKAFDRFFFGQQLLEDHPGIEKIIGDVRSLDASILQDVDTVIDLAAISNDPAGDFLPETTWEINHQARVRIASLAKSKGVKRYLLPSSCSVYGFSNKIVNEQSIPNPLTVYAKANLSAEKDVLRLADNHFCVTILRQATLYGYSPRIRFDLVGNAMVLSAYKSGNILINGNGEQWRPLLNVRDTARAMIFLMQQEHHQVNQETFNVGETQSNYQIQEIAQTIVSTLSKTIFIQKTNDLDNRSYQVSFRKIEALGFHAENGLERSIAQIWQHLTQGGLCDHDKTYTLKWYRNLIEWNKLINDVAINHQIF